MSDSYHIIGPEHLSLERVEEIVSTKLKLKLGKDAEERIETCRAYLDEKVVQTRDPIYGVNTGFGSLCDQEISKQDLRQLQLNLVRSHACGMGKEVPHEIVKLMLLLKIQGLAYGHSGVQLKTVQRLVDFYNENVLPVVYQQGSLGASGDLAPLAHLSLPLLGEGEVYFKGEKTETSNVNKQFNWQPIELMSKEGLALLNGTQFMSAYACHILLKAKHLMKWADFIAAASLDAFDGRIEPFHELIQQVRPHKGQFETAKQVKVFLSGSELLEKKKQSVQDPYSFRCIPQVHGASKDALRYVLGVVETEINSVTDNPTIFKEEDQVISAGNFHGQPLALAMDFLAIALAEVGSISERRTYKLISGQRTLPPFLTKNPGLNSGFMIVQYAVASMVSQNKQLATPSSVDSIDSSNGQEDHVSMGANAATKLYSIMENFEKVLGIEWLTACQALDFRDMKSSSQVERMKNLFRKQVPFIDEDKVMYLYMEQSRKFIAGNPLKKA